MILGPAGMLGSLGTGIMEMLLTAGQQNLKVHLARETALQITGRQEQHLVIHRHIKDQQLLMTMIGMMTGMTQNQLHHLTLVTRRLRHQRLGGSSVEILVQLL